MKQYPNIDAIIEDSDTKVQDLAKVIGVSTKQIRRWRDDNFRCRYAEIDIVAKDGEYLVFCEVKFRKTGGLSAALEAVSVPKQMRLSGAAVYYLMKNDCTEIPCRFDVIGIAGNKISLRKNAFEYCGDFGIV